MEQTATICPHCGFDGRGSSISGPARTGLAYSGLATLALVVGQVVAGFGCLIAIIGCVVAATQGDWLRAFVLGPIVALLMLSFVVVFARTMDVR